MKRLLLCRVALVGVGLAVGQAGGQEIPRWEGPVRVAGGVMARKLISKVVPVYPEAARSAGVEGTVVLHAMIGKDGGVKELTVVSGPAVLQASAVDAARQWVYKPYLLNGEAARVETTISVVYRLRPPAPALGADGQAQTPKKIEMIQEDAGEGSSGSDGCRAGEIW